MKPRARRVTIGAAGLGTGVLAILLVVHWDTVCEHFVGWHFQLTKETLEITPGCASELPPGSRPVGNKKTRGFDLARCLFVLATDSGVPVVVALDAAEDKAAALVMMDPSEIPASWVFLTEESARQHLRMNGWRIIEQRFLRRAHVVVLDVKQFQVTRL
jgi:hypothetical protein